MDKKILVYLLGVISFVSLAAASTHTPVDQLASAIVSVLGGVFERYVGAPLTDQNALVTLAAVAVYWYGFFIGLEAFLDKLGWLDRFTGKAGVGREESKWRLVAFSILLFLVFLGSGWFAPILAITRDSIILLFAIGTFAVLYGMFRYGIWGGTKEAVAANKELLADAKNREKEADELLNEVKREEQDAMRRGGEEGDAEARHAEQELEKALELMEIAVDDLEQFAERSQSDIYNAVQDAKAFLEDSDRAVEGAKNFEKLADEIRAGLSQILRRDWSDPANDLDVLEDVLDVLMNRFYQLEQDVIRLKKIADKELVEEKDEFSELTRFVQEYGQVEQMWEALPNEVERAVKEDKLLDKLAQKYGDEELESASYEIGKELEVLEEELQKLRNAFLDQGKEIESARKYLNEELKMTEAEKKELEDALGLIESILNNNLIENAYNQIRSEFSGVAGASDVMEDDDGNIKLIVLRDGLKSLRGDVRSIINEFYQIRQEVRRLIDKTKNIADPRNIF